jgi:hypothetical protein
MAQFEGELLKFDIKHQKYEGVVIETTKAIYEIDAFNDCCGFSEFYAPNTIDDMFQSCVGGEFASLEKIETDIDEYQEGITFKNDYPVHEELENYIFKAVFVKNGKSASIIFGLRSYHNGYYPANITITKTQTLRQLINLN